jgi:hypothetical protein
MGNTQTKKLANKTPCECRITVIVLTDIIFDCITVDKHEIKRLREIFDSVVPLTEEPYRASPSNNDGKLTLRRKRSRSLGRNHIKEDYELDREQFKKIFKHCCGVQELNVDLDKVFPT